MSIAFYTDTHIAKQVAIQLRQRVIDVVRCEDIGLAMASDLEHLEYAANHRLTLITKDNDFLRLHHDWLSQGREHAGIFFCRKRFSPAISEIVSVCREYYALIQSGAGTPDDIHNQIIYV